jgi:branched-chain amino acid transport system substrate-binding protein
MAPGQHHVRMNMYIARVTDGKLRIVKSLGAIDPKERLLPATQFEQAPAI